MLDYMIYILAFAVGSILCLLYSYKQHGEPFVAETKFNVPFALVSIVGWVLGFCSGSVILSAIGFLLAGFVMGERPGYGRKETALGLIIAIIVYFIVVVAIKAIDLWNNNVLAHRIRSNKTMSMRNLRLCNSCRNSS